MELEEVFKNRRSVRNFKDQPVPMEIINEIIIDSTLAPNAGNEQPWKFIIIRNREMINRISSEGKANILRRIENNPGDYAERYKKMLLNEKFNVFYNSPAVIMIIGKSDLKNLYSDCALAACYLMMSATSKGLGTCWVNFATEIKDPNILEELGLPDNHKIIAPIALGYPVKIPEIPKRKEPQILKVVE